MAFLATVGSFVFVLAAEHAFAFVTGGRAPFQYDNVLCLGKNCEHKGSILNAASTKTFKMLAVVGALS